MCDVKRNPQAIRLKATNPPPPQLKAVHLPVLLELFSGSPVVSLLSVSAVLLWPPV